MSTNDEIYIKQYSIPVKEGKIIQEWNAEYDREAHKNDEEYYLPEFLFKFSAAQPKRVDSKDSKKLKICDWIKIELVDDEGNVMDNCKIKLITEDGNEHSFTTNDEGKVETDQVVPGKIALLFEEKS